jgi:3-hydroxybutyrate dehydrogenase
MTIRFDGRVAIVTGAAAGLGRSHALALAARGAKVIVNDFGGSVDGTGGSSEPAEKVAAEIRHGGGVALAHGADVTNPAQVAHLVTTAMDAWGRVDILVNNAGIQFVSPIEDFPVEKWDQIIAVNLSSAFHATRAAVPGMKRRKWGRIVNIASAHGLVASAEKVAYVAAKHGLVGLTKVVAIEAANDGVTCNAICPGWVLTPLVEQQITARAKANGQTVEEAKRVLLAEKQPMLQFSTPEGIAALTVFLCSEAASTMTGAAYSIDGGWVAQ